VGPCECSLPRGREGARRQGTKHGVTVMLEGLTAGLGPGAGHQVLDWLEGQVLQGLLLLLEGLGASPGCQQWGDQC